MALTAVLIDDEPLARQELQYLLEAAGEVEIVAQGSNGIEAVGLIRTHRPDVLFLDVQMPGLDGFSVLKKVMAADRKGRLPQVVFATAFDQYAVKAFEVNAVDYLLKPFDKARLVKTLDKVRSRIVAGENDVAAATASASGNPNTNALAAASGAAEAKLDALLQMMEKRVAAPAAAVAAPRSSKVVLRAAGRMLLVDQREICFAAIEDGKISVVTKTVEGEANVRTLEELAEQMNPDQFWRAHRSFLVNIQHIREVVPWFKSSYQLRMDDRKSTEVPVSRGQTRRLRELFNL